MGGINRFSHICGHSFPMGLEAVAVPVHAT